MCNTLFSPKIIINTKLAKLYYFLLHAMPIRILEDMEASSKSHTLNASPLVLLHIDCLFLYIFSCVAYLVLSSTICHLLISVLFQLLVNTLIHNIISLLRLVITGET